MLANSDHREIRCKIKWEKTQRNKNVSRIPDFRRADFDGLRRYLQGTNWHQMASERGTQVVEVRSQEGVARCEGEGVISGEIRMGQSEWRESGDQVEEVRSEGTEHEVEGIYNCFVNNLYAGQIANIPYRAIRTDRNDPKWMNARLKHCIGLKRGIYKKVKAGDDSLRPRYNELARTVRKLTKNAKNTYELKVASQAKTDPKGFYQLYTRR